jgi:hypothetical protein
VQYFSSTNDLFGYHGLNWVSMGGGGTVSDLSWEGSSVLGPAGDFSEGYNLKAVVPGTTGRTRANFSWDHCVSTGACGNPQGACFQMNNVSGTITVTNVSQYLNPGRTPPMRMVRVTGDATLIAFGNTPDTG